MKTERIKQEIARDLLDHLLDEYSHTLWKIDPQEYSEVREIKYTVDMVSYELFFHLMLVTVRLNLTHNIISLQVYSGNNLIMNVSVNKKLVDYYKEQLLEFTNFSTDKQ